MTHSTEQAAAVHAAEQIVATAYPSKGYRAWLARYADPALVRSLDAQSALDEIWDACVLGFDAHVRTSQPETCDGLCCFADIGRLPCCREGWDRLPCIHRRRRAHHQGGQQ